jgi:hypothetical protein
MGKLKRNADHQVVLCYAEGCDDVWEAFCPDFDLAVQGRSFQDVYNKLEDAIDIYLQGVLALPEIDQKRLLNRKAPIPVWASLLVRMIMTALVRHDNKLRHEYTLPARGLASAV